MLSVGSRMKPSKSPDCDISRSSGLRDFGNLIYALLDCRDPAGDVVAGLSGVPGARRIDPSRAAGCGNRVRHGPAARAQRLIARAAGPS